jgi:putative glutamine amidotransferase
VVIIVEMAKRGRLWHIASRNECFGPLFDVERVIYAEYGGRSAFAPRDGDAVCIWGGADISPTFYHEKASLHGGGRERVPFQEQFIWDIIHQAVAYNIPLIGVCRGAQILCAAAGGSLVQHVTGHHGDHPVTLQDGRSIMVSSTHHQMMRPGKVDHVLLAWAEPRSSTYEIGEGGAAVQPDEFNVEPEAIYFPNIRALAMQWHPEFPAKGSSMADVSREYVQEFLR